MKCLFGQHTQRFNGRINMLGPLFTKPLAYFFVTNTKLVLTNPYVVTHSKLWIFSILLSFSNPFFKSLFNLFRVNSKTHLSFKESLEINIHNRSQKMRSIRSLKGKKNVPLHSVERFVQIYSDFPLKRRRKCNINLNKIDLKWLSVTFIGSILNVVLTSTCSTTHQPREMAREREREREKRLDIPIRTYITAVNERPYYAEGCRWCALFSRPSHTLCHTHFLQYQKHFQCKFTIEIYVCRSQYVTLCCRFVFMHIVPGFFFNAKGNLMRFHVRIFMQYTRGDPEFEFKMTCELEIK